MYINKRKFKLATVLLLGVLLTLLFAGCGDENAKQEGGTESETAATQEEEIAPSYVVADASFSNLQLAEPNVPVYDKLTLDQRQAEGLPTALPEIKLYKEGKVAYLTFDDGPDDKNTAAILDILKENNVVATFYVTGAHAELYPEAIKRMFTEGHAIGNHSYDHDYKKLYPSVDGFLSEMKHTDEIIMKIIGLRPLILRAPGGTYSQFNASYWAALKANGYVEHDWNVSSADAAPNHPVAQDFIDNIDYYTLDGKQCAIILMHCSEGHEETVKALPKIIQLLKDRGYSFGVVTPMTPQPW